MTGDWGARKPHLVAGVHSEHVDDGLTRLHNWGAVVLPCSLPVPASSQGGGGYQPPSRRWHKPLAAEVKVDRNNDEVD